MIHIGGPRDKTGNAEVNQNYGYEQIIIEISSHENCNVVFEVAIKLIEKCLKEMKLSKHEAVRSKLFTDKLRDEFEQQIPKTNVTNPSSGRTKSVRR